ncbi:MAG TPA: hypothetical protein VLV83_01460 [Acidobacteriota bacterium]|nr:hypothetical protein [Acidobacteriota bacterium]
MNALSQAAHELDSCRDIQSGWKHLRSRLQEDRVLPLKRNLQSLRNARPHPDTDDLEDELRHLRRLPSKLRPRLWRYRAANTLLALTSRLLRRSGN